MRIKTSDVGIQGYEIDWTQVTPGQSAVLDISEPLQVAATKSVSHPVFLVELLLKEVSGTVVTVRLSSAGHKSLSGHPDFSQSTVDFGVISHESVLVSGLTQQSVTLSLDNSTKRYAFFALSDVIPLKDQRVRVWSAYSEHTLIPNDQIALVFDGYIDSVLAVNEKEVKFTANAQSISAGWCPRIYLSPPLCNHLPKAGTKIGNLILEPGN